LEEQSDSLSNSRQLGYGLGTAHAKKDGNAPLDKELIKTVVMAIQAGFGHLDGAQGPSCSALVCVL
jgi:hypothetical protein